jgi:hypothetical protein
VRQGGAVVRLTANPAEISVTEIPEWRIVDDATWFAVNAKFTTREPGERSKRAARGNPVRALAPPRR